VLLAPPSPRKASGTFDAVNSGLSGANHGSPFSIVAACCGVCVTHAVGQSTRLPLSFIRAVSVSVVQRVVSNN
jgi:hypothetical protein